jgi:hypothetical protein
MPLAVLAVLVSLGFGPATGAETRGPQGPYLGQRPPGAQALPFAPGLVNAGLPTRDMTLTPAGDELYFTVFVSDFTRAAVVVARHEAEGWTVPKVAPFARDARFRTLEPCISPDGQRFFFVSDRPEDPDVGERGRFGIWVMERGTSGWGAPRRLPGPVNGEVNTYFPSVTRDGTLYFTRDEQKGGSGIWRSRLESGQYRSIEPLPAAVNLGRDRFNAFVAPDESYLIIPVAGREDTLGGVDYYVVFRRADDAWSAPQSLGPEVNSPARDEYSASVSPDGKYLFFMSSRGGTAPSEAVGTATIDGLRQYQKGLASQVAGVYWIDASPLEELRARAVFPDVTGAAR